MTDDPYSECNDDCLCFEDELRVPFIGRTLPNIHLDAFHNGQITPVQMDDYRGKWLAIVFYPADFTFVCPTELQDLAELYPQFQKEEAEVVSVSTDTAYTHLAWHASSKAVGMVEFPMLADPAGKLGRALGVYLEDEGLCLRGSFIVDPDGVIQTMEIHNNSIGRSGEELLRKLRAAKFVREHGGEVCPANWKPGAKTLKPSDDLVGKI
jgi:peroxiredoxin (alkyl hydroperoxide reductase subunit C)